VYPLKAFWKTKSNIAWNHSLNGGKYLRNSSVLHADIEECLMQIDSGNDITRFPLASKDISIKLNIPQ